MSRVRRIAWAVVLLAYFLYFSWDALQTHFEADDMMNLGRYWRLSIPRLLLEQLPWRGYFRPMGGFFYKPVFEIFGLNPAPYHAVILAILLLNIWLLYLLARTLGCRELTAGLAAFLVCYHAGLGNLQYAIDVVYDILCFTFFLASLLYYIRIRRRGRLPRPGELAIFLGLYLCALNSKEMAVTLPVMMVVWEWLYGKTEGGRRRSLPIVLAALLNVAYIYGRAFGHDPLLTHSGYAPVFSAERFLAFQTSSFADLFYQWGRVGGIEIGVVWGLLFAIAWISRHPALRFCWLWMAITPLPIEFLPVRTKACLYIPLAGWAILAAVLLVGVAESVAHAPGVRRLGTRAVAATLVLAGMFGWAAETRRLKNVYIRPAMTETGKQTWDVIRQLRALDPRPRRNSQVVFLSDPFAEYDMEFIAELWFHDPSISVWLQRKDPRTPEQLAAADYLFSFDGPRLVRLR